MTPKAFIHNIHDICRSDLQHIVLPEVRLPQACMCRFASAVRFQGHRPPPPPPNSPSTACPSLIGPLAVCRPPRAGRRRGGREEGPGAGDAAGQARRGGRRRREVWRGPVGLCGARLHGACRGGGVGGRMAAGGGGSGWAAEGEGGIAGDGRGAAPGTDALPPCISAAACLMPPPTA